ncbi:DUF1003 domain-containing protein [Methylobacterium sp. J-059]|jgi:uncharacterized membrane protein|uniref:DUF1003 domain-containing protein n=1 Tax=Methylobacterium sp. J-059 TaxID=2836643 RepID=UPI001FBA4D11|nr:DUF1003 domain-containing protein [Methylobacterium sp. J-059]MCJ2041019.1 DUF1003 domain-containing protein [Methylobacterium sp. J-059]
MSAGGDEAVARLARQLLDQGLGCLSPHDRRVLAHIAGRVHARDAGAAATSRAGPDFGERLADRVARLGGSWGFIIAFTGLLVGWVVLNTVVLAGSGGGFDAYPYIFLNLILSMVAALQAPVILMSQNRQAERDRIAAGLDYEVNLRAEIEIVSLHDKLDRIRTEQLEDLIRAQTRQIAELGAARAARPRG